MQNYSPIAVRVGIFFTLAMILVMALSLRSGKGGIGREAYELTGYFTDAAGIEEGTKVSLKGVPIGFVKKLGWDSERYKVEVVMSIEEKYRVPQSAKAQISSSSLLGGSFVYISFDPQEVAEGQFLEKGGDIPTKSTPSIEEMMANLGNFAKSAEGTFGKAETLFEDAKTLVNNLNENQAETLGKINTVIEENREALRETTESFRKAGPEVEKLAERLNSFAEDMQQGQGTLGRLMQSDEVYTKVDDFLNKAEQIATDIRAGTGTLTNLIYSDDMAVKAETSFKELERAATEVRGAVADNRQNLEDLMATLQDSMPRMEDAFRNIDEISAKINNGEGTLGKMVNDPSLYEDAKDAINQVGESFEESEEQGVIRSFMGILFGAVI